MVSPIISVSPGSAPTCSISRSSMSGCGFGKPSSAQRVAAKKRADAMLGQRVVEARPRLAGRHAEHDARRAQLGEHLAHAGKQRNRRFAREVVMPVARDEIRLPLRRQVRRHVAQRVGEPEPDHVARVDVVGHRRADVAARLLQRLGDDRRRVGQRAVPVEDDETEPARRE